MLSSFVIGAALLTGAMSKGEVVEASRSMRSDSETLDLILDLICRDGKGGGEPTAEPTAPIEIDDWEIGQFWTHLSDNSIKDVGGVIETTRNAQVINSGLGEITAPFTIWMQSRSKDVGRPHDGGARFIFSTGQKCDRNQEPKQPNGRPCLRGSSFTAIDVHIGGWGRDRGNQAYRIAGQPTICWMKDGNHRHIGGACQEPDWPLAFGDAFWMGISVSETGRIKTYIGDNGEDLDTVKQNRLFGEDVMPGVNGRPDVRDKRYPRILSGYVWVSAGGVPLEMSGFVYEESFMEDAGARMLSSSRMEFLPASAARLEEGVNQCRQVVDAAVEELDNRSPFLWAGVTLAIGLVGGYGIAAGIAARKKMVVVDESTQLLRA